MNFLEPSHFFSPDVVPKLILTFTARGLSVQPSWVIVIALKNIEEFSDEDLLAYHFQLIIPERLAESIQHLRCDEGLESTSNPATPVPTPISPIFALQGGLRAHQVLPEQVCCLFPLELG